MTELLAALGSCALLIYIAPALAGICILLGALIRFKPWRNG